MSEWDSRSGGAQARGSMPAARPAGRNTRPAPPGPPSAPAATLHSMQAPRQHPREVGRVAVEDGEREALLLLLTAARRRLRAAALRHARSGAPGGLLAPPQGPERLAGELAGAQGQGRESSTEAGCLWDGASARSGLRKSMQVRGSAESPSSGPPAFALSCVLPRERGSPPSPHSCCNQLAQVTVHRGLAGERSSRRGVLPLAPAQPLRPAA